MSLQGKLACIHGLGGIPVFVYMHVARLRSQLQMYQTSGINTGCFLREGHYFVK